MANCDWCRDTGLVTAYHKLYRGDATVWVEEVDAGGEVHGRKMPGTIAAHCSCSLGAWMRDQTSEDLRKRIPDFGDICQGRYYQFEDPTGCEADETRLSESALAFLRGWKRGLGMDAKRVRPGRKWQPEEVANALRERAARDAATAREEATS